MLAYIVKRFFQTLIVLFLVVLIVFVLIRLAPGNPALMMLPADVATPEMIAELEAKMGIDKPIYEQFWRYLVDIFHGDLGMSTIYKQPVFRIILPRIKNTVILAVGAVILAALMAIPLGIFAGANRGKFAETFCMLFALLGQSMSTMWLGVLCIFIFAVTLGWLPALGTGGIKYMILPILTLGYPMAASLARVARSGMADTLSEDYITATYSRGTSSFQVYTKYALRNALIPVTTIMGINLGIQLSGAVVVEQIFSWTGIGHLMYQSVSNLDYPLVQALLLLSAFLFTFINFLVDIINSFIDPRLTLY